MTKPLPIRSSPPFCTYCLKVGVDTPRQDALSSQYLHNYYCPSCVPKIDPDDLDPDDLWDRDPDSDFWLCYTTTPLDDY